MITKERNFSKNYHLSFTISITKTANLRKNKKKITSQRSHISWVKCLSLLGHAISLQYLTEINKCYLLSLTFYSLFWHFLLKRKIWKKREKNQQYQYDQWERERMNVFCRCEKPVVDGMESYCQMKQMRFGGIRAFSPRTQTEKKHKWMFVSLTFISFLFFRSLYHTLRYINQLVFFDLI